MKITKNRLKEIITEEISAIIAEGEDWDGDTGMPLSHKAMKMCAQREQCADKWIHNPSPENKAAMDAHRKESAGASKTMSYVKPLVAQFDKSMKAAQERGDRKAFEKFNAHRRNLAKLMKDNNAAAIEKLAQDWGVV